MSNQKNEYLERLFEVIPKEAFLDPEKMNLYDNPAKHVKVGIVSETTNVFINRNNSATSTTSYIIEGKPRVMVPAQKWKGCEQSNFVKLAREMNLLPESYRQNMIASKDGLLNPVTAIFGDTVTASSEGGQVRGRVAYDWAYSLEPVAKVTKRLQHNTLDEDGTIKKAEDQVTPAPEALHRVQYIVPGISFMRFISLDNMPPHYFLFYLAGVLSTHSYGARKKIVGDNIKNKLIAVSWGNSEQPLSSYSVLKEYWHKDLEEIAFEEVAKDAMMKAYGTAHTIFGTDVAKLTDISHELIANLDQLRNLLYPLQEWIEESWPFFKK